MKSMLHGVLLAAVGSLTLMTSASADEVVQCAQKKERKVVVKALLPRTYKRLERIYEMIGEEQYIEAEKALLALLPKVESKGYENAVVSQALGHVAGAKEDYNSAIRYFNIAVQQDILPNRTQYQIMYQIATLHMVKNDYAGAISQLKKWLCAVPVPTDSGYSLLANAYAQTDQFRNAIVAMRAAIKISKKPKESWYQLLLAMHFSLKEFKETAKVLEILVQMRPEKKTYWNQLSSMYLQLKLDEKALATMALAYRKDLLDKENDWLQLFSLYGFLDVPEKAARVLQDGLERGVVEATSRRWEDVGNAWYAAQELEKALIAYKTAAKTSTNGKLDLRISYILRDLERWADLVVSLQAAVKKGGLKESETGNAYLMIGESNFELGRNKLARAAFRKARKHKKSKNAAEQWIRHIQEEEKRKGANQASR